MRTVCVKLVCKQCPVVNTGTVDYLVIYVVNHSDGLVVYNMASSFTIPDGFCTVGVSHGDLLDDIDRELSEYFPSRPSRSRNVNRPTHDTVNEPIVHSDSEESDEENVLFNNSFMSPVIQTRIRDFLRSNPVSDESDDEEFETEDGGDRSADLRVPTTSDFDSPNENVDIEQQINTRNDLCQSKCMSQFHQKDIIDHKLNIQSMTNECRDILIMGQLQACGTSKGEITRTGDRKRHRFNYTFLNVSVCKDCFLFLNNIGDSILKAIRKHMYAEGAVPRRHGNTRRTPKHAVTYEATQQIVQFITRFADERGLPQPAAPRGRDDMPPIYIPGTETYKTVHQQYVSACESRPMSETTFRRIWHRVLPHIRFMTHRTDVCHKCELYRDQIQKALTEEQKLAATSDFTDHIHSAQKERDFYRQKCVEAVTEVQENPDRQPQDLQHVHYTFDFAQSICLPSHCRQEGALYFRSLYKANLFGVCNDGRAVQTNYIFGEDESIGIDSAQSHSANSVVSMLHHYLTYFGEGEKTCYFNADNCGGQNKNQVVTSYFAWRVANGLHDEIYLHFMKPYHARCLVDGMFGIARRRIRRSDCDSIQNVMECVESSSPHNKAVTQSTTEDWHWRDWKGLFKPMFRAVTRIQQYHHFRFSSLHPGVVKVKKTVDGEEVDIPLVKRGKSITSELPRQLEVGGHSLNRSWYLYKNVRQFVKDPWKDVLCPLPDEPEPSASVTEE